MLRPIYEAFRERNRLGEFHQADETRWLVFVLLEGKKGYGWWLDKSKRPGQIKEARTRFIAGWCAPRHSLRLRFCTGDEPRHRCLLALAAASLLGVLGTIAGLVSRMHPVVEQLPSGAIRIDTSLATAGEWLMMSGMIIGAVGGVAAIHWALTLRRCT
jgi:hypothetical protein